MTVGDRNQAMLDVLASLGSKSGERLDLADIPVFLSNLIGGITGFEKTILAISNGESELEIFESDAEKPSGKILASQGSALQAAINDGKPIIDMNIGKFSQYFDIRKLQSDGYGSCAIFPLSQSRKLGAVAFAGRRKGILEQDYERFLKAVAGITASLVASSVLSKKHDASKRMCDIVFEGSSEALILSDMSGKILSANERASDLAGIPGDAMIQKNIYDFYSEAQDVMERLEKAREGGMQEFVSLFRKKSGERFVRTRLRVLKDDAKPLAAFSCLDITESLLAGTYQDVMSGFGDITFSIDADKRFVSISHNVRSVLGYSEEELINEPFATIVATKDNTLINELIGWMKSKSDKVDGLEIRLALKSGATRLFTMGGRGFFNSKGELIRIYGILRETESLKKAGEQERFYSEILSELSDGVWGVDNAGYIRYWNKAAERLLEYSREEAIGRDARMLFPPEKEWEFSWALSGRSIGKAFETERVKKSGEHASFRVIQKPIKSDLGELIGYVEILRDLELEKKFKETERVKRELEERNRRLREFNDISTAFVSNVSHEIRTPLTSIHGFSLLMQEGEAGKLTPEQKKYIDIIASETERLRRLINDVLEISRIDSMRFKLELQEFNLASLMDKCSCSYQAQKKGLYVNWEFEEDLPQVYGDPVRISQVLINLISNAIKFTEKGGVTVKAFRKGRSYVQVDVIDTGEGIPEDEQKSIFKRFYQASSGKKREGTGLGLAITEQIVKLHKGKIWLESKVGEGSKFSFTIPIKKRERKMKKLSPPATQQRLGAQAVQQKPEKIQTEQKEVH